MLQVTQRSKAPRKVEGPRVGAIVTRDGVTVKVLTGREPGVLVKRATIVADDDTSEAIKRAAQAVAARIVEYAQAPVPVTIAL